MCGITGWIDWQADLTTQKPILDAMVETLTTRGPDAFGTYITHNAALGHRRLSVVDLEGGRQPMTRKRGDHAYTITYNGELYNTPELQADLEARGYRFSTHSDTEVLLTAYIEYGPSCVEHFNGIFAFAIWDEEKEQLYLARDRMGVKPLFYAERGSAFFFGSELKALLAHPAIEPEVGREGLAEIFMIGPARTPGHGVFKNIAELKPGCSMIVNRNGKRSSTYWKLESKPHNETFAATITTVRELLQDAVKRQLVADVPVCTLLSGGLDSSALTAFAAQSYKEKGNECLHTYSVDYVDNDLFFQANAFQPNSDAPWVKRVSEYFSTCHHLVELENSSLADTLPIAAKARDLPGMADVDTSLYLFCEQIKKGATVALSGECADEVFGGYPWFRREDLINADTFPWSRFIQGRTEWLTPAIKEKFNFQDYVASRYSDALKEVPRLPGEAAKAARMREIFYLSLTRFMPTLLDRKDRMSMAFGLEVRVPFCDHRIVDYVWNVPWEMKNYQDREKGLLRHALTGVLPEDVLWRKKSPYPKTHNPAYLNTVRERLLAILNDRETPLHDLINTAKIREIAQSAEAASNIPWFGQLMGGPQLFAYLIQMDTWLKAYQVRFVE
ncbi:asparagine synthase (glutamine-hydrolyzing) [Anaerospora sp.]|jgi:asparagine synthase (glutamine-hydrolysing)|uniref:asparagine synthase (glutamine-hydrolyzing) n=1 Tax=Anaerospora sp. TaxID=1960278 RepID=UPI00289C5DD2|nr:asparagine synthase (glutamine-hydrolyzing) [Anaerospora sp.]MDF2929578.1 asnO 2 [Anaerospora sp.]